MKSLLNSWASRTASRRWFAISRISSSVYSPRRFSSIRLRIERMIASTSTSSERISKVIAGSSQKRHRETSRRIHDHDDREGPERDGQQQRPVGEEDVRRAAAQ